jgi:ABC-type transport system involved in multi-copper enzyme maturation permease subunit
MSTATDSTTSPPDKNSLTVLRDFSDRLSPIVVKELRQGLRQPSFVILFLFLQSVLAMAVITSLFAVSSASLSERVQTGNVISGFFFGLFALSVLIIQPLRGLNALSSEIKQKTIDLLLLTKLSAWRIVFGKWLCLNTQSALLLVAILPYLMMRYFLGGMNILSELGGILAMFLVSGVFCAAGVGLSAVRSIILRTIFAILGVIALITMLQGSVFLFAFSRGPFISGSVSTLMSGSDWTLIITGSVLLAIYLTISFLEFGATRIAPPSENRSTRKRLLALIALFVIPTLFALPEVDSFYMSFIAIVIITALALADALSENPQHVRPMGENSFWMLRPGWPSGALFGLMLLAANIFWLFVLFGLLDSSRGFDSNGQKVVAQLVGTGLLIVSQPDIQTPYRTVHTV